MLKYYLLDCETNGLSSQIHEITEISIIRFEDRTQLSRFIKIEHPERTSPQALTATGRTFADLNKGYPATTVVEAVDKFFQEDGLTPEHRCAIAHSAFSLDVKFVHAQWRRLGKVFPVHNWIDTKPMMKKYSQYNLGIQKPKLTLTACLEHCQIKARGTAHSAVSDTQNLYLLHKYLIDQGFDYLPYIKRLPQEADVSSPEEDFE